MCDTLAIVEPGRVLWAKNSDRDPNEAQHLDWQPGRDHPPGSRVRCTWIEIPQARQTHAVLLSRPFWIWGAEMGTNEHGVTIGNEAVFTREPYAKRGLTGMDLVRLALERATTAREAVEVIVELIGEFGQGGGCGLENRRFTYHNSFLIADPQGAFVLETAGGHHAVESVTGGRSISNGLTIPGFAERHGDWIRTRASGCAGRRALTQAAANRATSVLDLTRVLRDHGAGGQTSKAASFIAPRYSVVNGGLGAPCVHAGGLLAASQTTASWVAELRPEGCRHWVTATAAPCVSLFKPVDVRQPLDLGPAPADRADAESLWWRHERLHRLVMRDPCRLAPLFLEERDEVERRWLTDPPSSAAAFAEADDLLARWARSVFNQSGDDRRPAFVRRYWNRRNSWAGLRLDAPPAPTQAKARVLQAARSL
jgi:dipeptidase